MARPETLLASDAKYCLEQLRLNSRDMYLASLLLPSKIRGAIGVLHAFHAEISSITLAAPEPLAGEIRLQWWMDVLEGKRDDEASQNPLSRALLAVRYQYDLPPETLVRKLEAHIFDLYCDPMGDTSTLEAYLGETRSVTFQLAALIANPEEASSATDASGHTGVSTGCVAILENVARHRAQQRVHLPSDLLVNCGLTSQSFLVGLTSDHLDAIYAMIQMGRAHHAKAEAALKDVTADVRPAFAPLALVKVYLDRIERDPEKAFTGLKPVAQLRAQWALWRA